MADRYRRLVGIDLGIASAHTVRVLDECGETVAKRKCYPTLDSLAQVEVAALAGAPAGLPLMCCNRTDLTRRRPTSLIRGIRGRAGSGNQKNGATHRNRTPHSDFQRHLPDQPG